MATRCNIRVSDKENKLWIYRHWDGYPAGTGADLARQLKKAAKYDHDRLPTFVRLLLDQRDEQQSYETEPSRPYEITTGMHGDIEWLYEVSFGKLGIIVHVKEFKLREDKWVDHGHLYLGAFRSFVAKDLLAMRNRIKQLKRRAA